MPEDLQPIHRFVQSLRRRSRMLRVGQAFFYILATLCLAVSLSAILFSMHNSARSVLYCTLAVVLLGVVVGLRVALRGWGHLSPLLHHARLVEQQRPQLRGRLLIAVEGESHQVESGFLFRRAVKGAKREIEQVAVGEIHPSSPFGGAVALFSSALLLATVLHFTLRIGPLHALHALQSQEEPIEQVQHEPPIDERKTALVGDIVLRYTFPEYTGMSPVVVKNSDGTIHAPAGTRVQITARSKKIFTAVALQVKKTNQTFEQANTTQQNSKIINGREISTELTVTEPGMWRLLFRDKNRQVPSPDFKIEVDDDDPPVVNIEGKNVMTPTNRWIPIKWSAKDDYGIEEVQLEVIHNGETRYYPLRKPLNAPLQLSSSLRLKPDQIGLKAGDKASLRVVAYDNQPEVNKEGSEQQTSPADPNTPLGKRGESSAVEIEVIGPRMIGRLMRKANKEFLEVMLVILADFLEEDVPPSPKPKGMISWVEQVRQRFEPLQKLTKKHWGENPPSDFSTSLVLNSIEVGGRMMRFVLVTYDRNRKGRITEQDKATFKELHKEQIISLEKSIYLIDMMLRKLAFADMLERAEHLKNEAGDLEKMLERQAPEKRLLSQLDQMERLLKKLMAASQQLDNGGMKEFVNARSKEIKNLMSETRQAIAEGRLDDAKKMMKLLSKSLKELSEGIKEQMLRMQSEEDQLKDMYKQLIKDLTQQEVDQKQLSERLSEARKKEDQASQKLIDAWSELLELAEKSSRQGKLIISGVGNGKGWRSGSIYQYNKMSAELEGLRNAIRARSLEPSLDRLRRTQRRYTVANGSTLNEINRGRSARDRKPKSLPKVVKTMQELRGTLDAIAKKLQEIDTDQEESQKMQDLARQIATEQQQLNQQQQSLEQQVQKVEQALPTSDGSASRSIKEASASMQQAEERLSKGKSIPGEGFQRDATQRLRNTKEALEKQMEQFQQMQKQMQKMKGQQQRSGKSNEKDKEESEKPSENTIVLPDPEEHMTPEMYRRALLEGMSGDVPEEFRSLKKRYYEELVQQ